MSVMNNEWDKMTITKRRAHEVTVKLFYFWHPIIYRQWKSKILGPGYLMCFQLHRKSTMTYLKVMSETVASWFILYMYNNLTKHVSTVSTRK